MAITTLIIGLDYPEGNPYLTAGLDSARNITLTANARTDSVPEQCCIWNRTSPVYAKNLIIKAEALTGQLDEAVIMFDPNIAAPNLQGLEIETFSKADDELIRGYLYAVSEVLSRFLKKNHGHIIFIRKKLLDKNAQFIPLQVASAAFTSLAENLAEQFGTLVVPQITLVEASEETDDYIAQWLYPYLDAAKETSAKKRKAPRWIKPGEKPGKKLFG
jgi:hypothetical protein